MKSVWNSGDKKVKVIKYLEDQGGDTSRINVIKQFGFDVMEISETLKYLEDKEQITSERDQIILIDIGNFKK